MRGLIGTDNPADKIMTHHIRIAEAHMTNAFKMGQQIHSFAEA
jgi:hypothetical protein